MSLATAGSDTVVKYSVGSDGVTVGRGVSGPCHWPRPGASHATRYQVAGWLVVPADVLLWEGRLSSQEAAEHLCKCCCSFVLKPYCVNSSGESCSGGTHRKILSALCCCKLSYVSILVFSFRTRQVLSLIEPHEGRLLDEHGSRLATRKW